SGVLCEYFSAKRAWPDSCPGTKRFALHGASLSASRLKSWTSVTLALPGMVAHKVTGLASASVHARPASADAPGGEAVPGALITRAGRIAATGRLATGGLPEQGVTKLQQRGRQRRGARDDGGKHGIGHGDRHLKAPGGNATTVARRGAARGGKSRYWSQAALLPQCDASADARGRLSSQPSRGRMSCPSSCNPSLVRRHRMSSAVRANSSRVRYSTSRS